MSNINKQPQSLDKIAGVQDISHENAAACSGGLITLWTGYNQSGTAKSYTADTPDVSSFRNIFSSFAVEAGTTYRLYTGINYSGSYATLGGGPTGYRGNLGIGIDNNVESIDRLQ
jgi:hypothetical protein